MSGVGYRDVLCKSKVGENGDGGRDGARPSHSPEDVGWLYIAVDNSPSVKFGDGIANLPQKAGNFPVARWQIARF